MRGIAIRSVKEFSRPAMEKAKEKNTKIIYATRGTALWSLSECILRFRDTMKVNSSFVVSLPKKKKTRNKFLGNEVQNRASRIKFSKLGIVCE